MVDFETLSALVPVTSIDPKLERGRFGKLAHRRRVNLEAVVRGVVESTNMCLPRGKGRPQTCSLERRANERFVRIQCQSRCSSEALGPKEMAESERASVVAEEEASQKARPETCGKRCRLGSQERDPSLGHEWCSPPLLNGPSEPRSKQNAKTGGATSAYREKHQEGGATEKNKNQPS